MNKQINKINQYCLSVFQRSGATGEGRSPKGRRLRNAADKTTIQTSSPCHPVQRGAEGAARGTRAVLTIADVSSPCQPRWITRVDAADSNFQSAFAEFLPVPNVSAETVGTLTTSKEEFRPRLPTN